MIHPEFRKELKASEKKWECRKQFVYRMMVRFSKSRSTIFEWIRVIQQSD